MDPASLKMEEIYAIPVKYTESWLEMKDSKGFIEYWVVLKTHYMFFFKNQNTHCTDQHVGYINIDVGETKCTSKKGSKQGRCDFLLETSKKKYLFRAADDILRRRWIYAIDLVSNAEPPGPLPGDLDYKERTVFTPSPGKMKPRAHSIAVISCEPSSPGNFTPDMGRQSNAPSGLSLQLNEPLTIEESEEKSYDQIYIPPSWYFRNFSRTDAIELLQTESIGTYLLRNSESSSNEDHYTLSIKDLSRIRHHKIHLIPGGCFFEGASNAPFPNPTDAVSYLMKTKYVSLQPKPLDNNEVRHSGDGQEDCVIRNTNSEGAKQTDLKENLTSPITPSFGGHFQGHYHADNCTVMHTPALLPRPPDKPPFHHRNIPQPPELPAIASRQPQAGMSTTKGGSLPAQFRMRNRPLPDTPIYANKEIIRSHQRAIDDSYVDMHPNYDHEEDGDIPPPLPRKRSSKRNNNDVNYVSMDANCENQDSGNEYERPVELIQREYIRNSMP